MKCKTCNKPIIPKNKYCNNQQYCNPACRPKPTRTPEQQRDYLQKKLIAKHGADNLLPCQICGKLYLRPCHHARQVHKVPAEEYKREFGLDRIKGITTPDDREKMRNHNKRNARIVVDQNLIKSGRETRFRKGDKTLGRYERRQQTIDRLKTQSKKSIN